jgi:hypothetical protein
MRSTGNYGFVLTSGFEIGFTHDCTHSALSRPVYIEQAEEIAARL